MLFPRNIRLQLLAILIVVFTLLFGCSSSYNTATQPIEEPGKPQPPVQTSQPENQPSVNRVDIVYFHPKIRCAACMSVEIRTVDLIEKYYKDAMENGKLTFQTYELQDKQNAELVKKYGAISSQLFINTIVNGKEDISTYTKSGCRIF